VGDELRVVAEVAGEAHPAPGLRVGGRVEARGDVALVGVRVVVDRVDLDPVLRAAVAGLAADAVGELELLAAPLLGDVIGVAVEADLGALGVLQAEVAGDALGEVVREDGVGLGVLVERLPGRVLVLEHRAALGRHGAAVAGGVAQLATPRCFAVPWCGRVGRSWARSGVAATTAISDAASFSRAPPPMSLTPSRRAPGSLGSAGATR
jgi:hypothetical protein